MNGIKYIKGSVTVRRDLSENLWIVRVRPERKIDYVPGQYVTVGLPSGGKLVERPYSLASAPHELELEFFLELVPGGKLTPHLYDVPAGGEVFLRPSAKGRFLFDSESGNVNHFMVATVTGVAPFVAMIRDLVSRSAVPYRIVILHGASLSCELAYRDELASYARRFNWLQYIPTISRIWLDTAWPGEKGRVEDIARKYLDAVGFAPGSTTAYACGNPQMIGNVENLLQRAGFEKSAVKEEMYWPARAA